MRKLFVLMAAVAFVVAFTLPAAGEVSISGDAEMNLWYDSASKEVTTTPFDDDDMYFGQDTNSKITFDFKKEAIGGKVEIRYGQGDVSVRHWYATYKMGAGTAVVGQTYVPSDRVTATPKRGFGAMSGNIDSSRTPQLAYHIGGLKVALLQVYTGDAGIIPNYTQTDTSIPGIEASYDFTIGPVGLALFAGYQTYDEVNATDQSYSVDSTAFGFLGKFAVGPATIYATLYSAINPNEGQHWGEFDAAWDGTAIQDASIMGYAVSVGWKLSDALTFNAAYGYDESEVDLPGTWEDDEHTFFINAVISLAKGVSISPEFGTTDHGDRITPSGTTEGGDESWFGAEFKIRF